MSKANARTLSRRTPSLLIAVPLLVVTAGLSGCGLLGGSPATTSSPANGSSSSLSDSASASDTGSASATTTGPAPATGTTTATSATGARQDAAALVAQSRKALLAAKSVHIKGSMAESGERIVIDMRIAGSKGATGTIGSTKMGTFQLLRIGTVVYMRADKVTWQKNGVTDPAAANLLANKYVKINATSKDLAQIAGLTSITDLAKVLTPQGAVRLGAPRSIRGVPATPIVQVSSGDALLVAAKGTPLPLALVPKNANAGELDMFDYNAKVTLTPPPASQVLALPTG